MTLIQRVQDILTKPKLTWPVIAGEGGDAASIYSDYLIYLALVPAVSGFIGMSLIGFDGIAAGLRVPVMTGLVQMVVSFALTLAMVFVLARVVDALAPMFGGKRNRLNALKVVAYAGTASLLGGIVAVLPGLQILGVAASIYSLYLMFLGLPVLMRCPPEKAGAYTAVVTVCAIIAVVLLSAVSSLFLPGPVVRVSDAAGFGIAVVPS